MQCDKGKQGQGARSGFYSDCGGGFAGRAEKTDGGKKIAPFKLTYTNDGGLYIAVGYGEQPSGGYSIAVNELYLTENAIVIDTELKGPESAEESGAEKSYPYVVVQTEYLEQPIIFQ